ncbi:hypothetical protein CG021_25755 [Klebsiella pneumoniae]|nr:hypothetical protein CG021_25755 [Klebsiella pneumoniae]RIU74858.1 hypothetical protein D1621_26020 [Klebsiella pneumoniae]RIU99560.1 hypothetical protein D1622_26905 [Klebsiella pneumoniae]
MGAAGEQGGCPGAALRLHRTATLDGAEVVTGAYRQRGKFMTELQQMPGCRAETRRKPSELLFF